MIEGKSFLLIKLGPQEYMERLIKYGEIYMNSTSFFKENNNEEIGDIYEGVESIINGNLIYRKDLEYEKLYCMWCLNNINEIPKSIITESSIKDKSNHMEIVIDFNKFSKFNNSEDLYMVVIKDIPEFNKRIAKCCKELGYNITKGLVSYYDDNSKNIHLITPFMKRKKFEHQMELRYLINTKSNEPLILQIGNLEDIAQIFYKSLLTIGGEFK